MRFTAFPHLAKFLPGNEILFDQALLAEGGQLDDPASFVSRLNQLLLELSHRWFGAGF